MQDMFCNSLPVQELNKGALSSVPGCVRTPEYPLRGYMPWMAVFGAPYMAGVKFAGASSILGLQRGPFSVIPGIWGRTGAPPGRS